MIINKYSRNDLRDNDEVTVDGEIRSTAVPLTRTGARQRIKLVSPLINSNSCSVAPPASYGRAPSPHGNQTNKCMSWWTKCAENGNLKFKSENYISRSLKRKAEMPNDEQSKHQKQQHTAGAVPNKFSDDMPRDSSNKYGADNADKPGVDPEGEIIKDLNCGGDRGNAATGRKLNAKQQNKPASLGRYLLSGKGGKYKYSSTNITEKLQRKLVVDQCYLWKLRDTLPELRNFWEEESRQDNADTSFVTGAIMDDEMYGDGTEYASPVSVETQNKLNKCMAMMMISNRCPEPESQKGIDSEIDPTVKAFLILVSEKLDAQMLPNLFCEQGTPTSNLLTNMLAHHKLRSMFDFEKAVERECDLMKFQDHMNPKWNFRMIDEVAGYGTAINTVFQLKDCGVFRGAKRRLRFTHSESLTGRESKNLRIDEEELADLMGTLGMECMSNYKGKRRSDVTFGVSTSGCGWRGARKTPPKEPAGNVYKGQGKDGTYTGQAAGTRTPLRNESGYVYKGQGNARSNTCDRRIATPVLATPSRLRYSMGIPKTPRITKTTRTSRKTSTSGRSSNQSSIDRFIISSPRASREGGIIGKTNDERKESAQ